MPEENLCLPPFGTEHCFQCLKFKTEVKSSKSKNDQDTGRYIICLRVLEWLEQWQIIKYTDNKEKLGNIFFVFQMQYPMY